MQQIIVKRKLQFVSWYSSLFNLFLLKFFSEDYDNENSDDDLGVHPISPEATNVRVLRKEMSDSQLNFYHERDLFNQ